MNARYMLLAGLLVSVLTGNGMANVPFSISVEQKQLTEQPGPSVFTVVASADAGFTADVFLRVSSTTLTPSAFSFSRPRFDHPYTNPVQLTVRTSGAVPSGKHVIIVEGFNGSVVAADTCVLLVPERSGWTVYTTQNAAMPSDVVRSIQFDVSGVAWMATDNGVVRFDGDSMQSYLDDKVDLAGNVGSLALQHGTTPWVLQNSSILRMVGDEFREFNDAAIKGQPFRLCAGRNGEIWVYTRNPHSLARITNVGITVFDMEDLISDNPYAVVASMVSDRRNKLWLGFSGYNSEWIVTYDGMYWDAFDRSRFQLAPFQYSGQLVEDPALGVWSVSEYGLVHVRNNESTSYPSSTAGTFPGFRPTAFAIDSVYGHRWVGVSTTANHPDQRGGLARFTQNERIHYHSSNSPLPEATILDLKADASGRLWAATTGGLVIVDVNAIPGTVSVREGNVPSPERGSGTIVVAPNPMDARSTIRLNGWPVHDSISVVLRNVTGQVVQLIYNGVVTDTPMEFTLQTQTLASGSYMLHVYGQRSSAVTPIVVHY